MARVPPNAPKWGHRLNADIDQVEGIATAALGVANAAAPKNQKGAANGYAALDANGKVPDAQVPSGVARDAEVAAAVAAEAAARASADALMLPRLESASYTYNTDGTVATETAGGFTTTYTYNADQSVHTVTRNGVTLTYSYNADGTVSGVA